ncbi:MBL fold metallo-hydrolase [Silicimonas sp. MF1-12-2]|uniref:MBL fold metallo-hydrolase n=1 Tax=Silicimonas sp. MF1-12-2 TaxID=3384793 RepID=UPI0039B5E573
MSKPEQGRIQIVEDGLRRILAPNPGPMTYWGTNTFIVGEGNVAIVDPGPDRADHLDAILASIAGETVSHILVTHAHLDHSPLARQLSERTGAPILGFGPPEAGRTPTMRTLAERGHAGGGEGVDRAFAPHNTLGHGDDVSGDGWRLTALHTPGHFAGHLSFVFRDAVISGDHVMDWSSSLVSPPDGDLRAFMNTSRLLRDAGHRRLYPAHGDSINDPAERLGWLIAHRESRETDILNALTSTPRPIARIAVEVYADIPSEMLPAAERNVFAHLVDLHDRGIVRATPLLSATAGFSLI